MHCALYIFWMWQAFMEREIPGIWCCYFLSIKVPMYGWYRIAVSFTFHFNILSISFLIFLLYLWNYLWFCCNKIKLIKGNFNQKILEKVINIFIIVLWKAQNSSVNYELFLYKVYKWKFNITNFHKICLSL